MEERQDNTKNVKILLQMIKDEKLKELRENVKEAQGKAASIAKKLNEKENERRRKLKEEAELEAVAQGSTESEESVSSYNETPVETAPVEEEVKPAEVKKTKGGKKTAKAREETVAETPAVAEKPIEKPAEKVEAKAETKAEVAAEKPTAVETEQKPEKVAKKQPEV